MPIARPSCHSVTSIRSVNRNGPIAVSQSNVVPTPDRFRDVNRMATASVIQSTCEPMSRTARLTRAGGASIIVETRMRAMARSGSGRLAEESLGGQLRWHDVQQHAGAQLEPGAGGQLRQHVDVPVVVLVH